ncbi:MAG: tetratricopeptide repeat protein [Candidatus Thorarchaeota archaeon]
MPLLRRKDKEYERAAQLLVDGEVSKAIDAFREILSNTPNHVNAMVSLAVALLERQGAPSRSSDETKEALELLRRAAEMSPDNPVPVFNLGVCQRRIGMLQDALASFHRALEIEERQPLALLHIAEINYQLGNLETAIEYARKALIRDPALEDAMDWVRDAVRQLKQNKEKGTRIDKKQDRD